MASGASGYIDLVNSSYGITFRIHYEQTYDVASNTSDVSITGMQVRSSSNSGFLRYLDGSVAVAGTTAVSMSSYAGTHNIYVGSVNTFYNVSGSLGSVSGIGHNSDGSKTITISASIRSHRDTGSADWSVSGSQSVTLESIPRSSSFSVSDGTLGKEQTIKVTRQSAALSHTITYSCGSASGTVCTRSTSESIRFTPPISLASQNTTGTSVAVTFTLQSYSGKTEVGSAVNATVAMAIPGSVKPGCSLEVSEATGYLSRFGGYIQGQSKLRVSITGSPAYNAAIVSYRASFDGNIHSAQSFVTGALKSAGEQTISATVTDTRGRTSDAASATIEVLAYSPPVITELSVHRCDEDGTENDKGSYAKVTYSFSVTSLSDQNTKLVTLKYKKPSDLVYTSVAVPADDYVVSSASYVFDAEDDVSYDVVLVVTDTFQSTQRGTSVSTAGVILHFRTDGTGVGIGKLSEKPKALDLGWDINMYHHRICDVADPVDDADAVNKGSLLDLVYPVGVVCRLVSGIDPGVKFGGSWQQIEIAGSVITWERTA